MHTRKHLHKTIFHDSDSICGSASIYTSGGVTFTVEFTISIFDDHDEWIQDFPQPRKTFRGMTANGLSYRYAKDNLKKLVESYQSFRI